MPYAEFIMEDVAKETRTALLEACTDAYEQNGYGKWFSPSFFWPVDYDDSDDEYEEYWY
jgi:hypothetical protein